MFFFRLYLINYQAVAEDGCFLMVYTPVFERSWGEKEVVAAHTPSIIHQNLIVYFHYTKTTKYIISLNKLLAYTG